MSDFERDPAAEPLPEARITKKRWRLSIVWVVPLIAVLTAGVLVYDHLREWGPQITIRFSDASGVRTGQTQLKYRGIPIGDVSAVELSADQHYANVTVRLRHSAKSIAREGSMFWIVRPQVGLENITGLGTVLTGPEIQVLPGNGNSASSFTGLEKAPTMVESNGLRIVLRASRLGGVKPNAPVYYKGIEVGTIEDVGLTHDAAAVDIHVVIRKRYARLVRSSSKFWVVGGLDINAGLLKGVDIKLESLKSLLVPGIAFATPDDGAKPAPNGLGFLLYDEPRREWMEWAPKISLPREGGKTSRSP
ncbi:MAG TPA: MlaD family protein [Burkholderiales bacterium]|nr:MlaD family protein [Burkholderiales bacterium]